MMPSSPPNRGWDRQPQSPAKSQYSIDLGALDAEGGSEDDTTPLPQQHIDRVLSDEIGGPSDFTLNLEKWMRGGTLKKNQKPAMKDAGVGDSLAPQQNDVEDEWTESHHTPSATPPKESVFARQQFVAEGRPDEASSQWDPYAEAATPRQAQATALNQHFLQPTVEDYHSELTPARFPSAQYPTTATRASGKKIVSPPQSGASTPGRPSSETLSPVRSPELQRSRPSTSHTQQNTLEYELRNLREKCVRLEMLNASLSEAVEDERRHRIKEAKDHKADREQFSWREKELTNQKDDAFKHMQERDREFDRMKERLQAHENQQFEGRDGIERLKRDYEGEIKRLKEESEHEKTELNQELRALEQDLELARRGRDDAEDQAKALQAELQEYRDEPDAELDRMRRSLRDDDGPSGRVAELEEELRSARTENEKLKNAKESAEERAGTVRAELSVVKQTQDEETARLTSDHRRAVSLAEDLQAKLKDMRRQLKEQQASHEKELKGLKSSTAAVQPTQQKSTTVDETELQRLRAELEAKQVELNTAILERDDAKDTANNAAYSQQQQSDQAALNDAILERDAVQDSLQTTQSNLETTRIELANLKLELSDLRAVNSALDVRVSEAIRKREVYWRARVDKLDNERKLMAKALMRMWGREEVGIEDPQRYAYMFTEKEMAK